MANLPLSLQNESVQARFWSKVAVRGPDECWEWQGAKRAQGSYGRAYIGAVTYRAHRVALALSTGDLPQRLYALHSCDNPPCCNPAHLRWGECAENMADAIARDRDQGFGRINREKTLCAQGHPLSGPNLRVTKRGLRKCRECESVLKKKIRAQARLARSLPLPPEAP
jgi:hypothetical protein